MARFIQVIFAALSSTALLAPTGFAQAQQNYDTTQNQNDPNHRHRRGDDNNGNNGANQGPSANTGTPTTSGPPPDSGNHDDHGGNRMGGQYGGDHHDNGQGGPAADPHNGGRDNGPDGGQDRYGGNANERDHGNREADSNGERGDNGRWDPSQHNGYTWHGRWYFGQPPSAYFGRPGFAAGYHTWRRGDRLPRYYRDRYERVDYRTYHLRRPPRGYYYVRDDRGEILLVGIATGIILSAILENH